MNLTIEIILEFLCKSRNEAVQLLYDVRVRARASGSDRKLIGWKIYNFLRSKQLRFECTNNDLFWFSF